jgi:transcriptional regulator with XRE-family HTH domain
MTTNFCRTLFLFAFGMKCARARKMIDIDKRIISRYETDKTIPSIDVAKKIANALEFSLDYLTELDYSLYINDQEMTELLKAMIT